VKRFLGSFITVGLILFLSTISIAQGFTTDGKTVDLPKEKLIYFSGSVDTTENYTSKEFFLNGFDDSFTNITGIADSLFSPPITVGAKLSGTSNSTRKISLYLKATNFKGATPVIVDTILYKDSTNSEINKTIDFHGTHYYRWFFVVDGETGNSDTAFDILIYAWKQDP
jgi:hypothetical protein